MSNRPLSLAGLVGSALAVMAGLVALGGVIGAGGPAPRVLERSGDRDKKVPALGEMSGLPLLFVRNVGQAPGNIDFLSSTGGVGLALSRGETRFRFPAHQAQNGPSASRPQGAEAHSARARAPRGIALRTRLVKANPTAKVRGENRSQTRINYLRGSDPRRWRTNVPAYERVRTVGVYPGIDMVHYGRQSGQLEYDFVVAPGADPDNIRLAIDGADRIRLTQNGDLAVSTAGGELLQHQPFCYQEVAGRRIQVEGAFRIASSNASEPTPTVSFQLGEYNAELPLVIDPVLSFSSYLGGSVGDDARGVAVDPNGAAYVTGATVSSDFPVTPESFDTAWNFGNDAYVAKFAPDGQSLEWATFLGGSGDDIPLGIAVSEFRAFITGSTNSTDFPTTLGALDETFNGGSDAFVARLTEDGTGLVYGTFYGGAGDEDFNDAFFIRVGGIAVDNGGNAVITGVTNSIALPVLNAAQPAYGGGASDGFVARISENGSTLLYGSYLGGSGAENLFGGSVAVDADGVAYLTGDTQSTNFPATATAFQGAKLGTLDAYVSQIDTAAAGAGSLLYSTYFGGNGGDGGESIAIDSLGNAYVVGATGSSPVEAFPLRNPFQALFGGGSDGFVAKFNPAQAGGASLVFASYLGGSGTNEAATAVAVDSNRAVYVSGFTSSNVDFPLVNPLQAAFGGGGGDGFVTKVNPAGTSVAYSTYLGGNGDDALFSRGGIAVDANRNAYVVGYTQSTNFSVRTPFQGVFQGEQDGFIAKICEGTLPAAPAQLAVVSTAATTANLTWNDLSNNESGFRLERRTGNAPFAEVKQVAANAKSTTDTGLLPNTPYDYRLRAVNACGFSTYSNPASGTTLPLPPAAPTALTVTVPDPPDGQTSLRLDWTQNSDNETGFKIERKTGAGAFVEIGQVGADVVTFSNVALTPNTSFSYRVRAFNTGGNSAFSNTAVGATLPLPPAAPTGLTATVPAAPDGRTKLQLNWTQNSDNEAGFKIERKEGAGGAGAFAEIGQVGANAVAFLDSGLAPNTQYSYQVRAFNSGGNSAFTNTASATTLRGLGGTLQAPASVNFGKVKRGKEKQQTLTLANTHASELLHVDVGTPTGSFRVVTGGGGFDLKPGQTHDVTLAIKSRRKGASKGTLPLTSSDPAHATVSIPLKAKIQ